MFTFGFIAFALFLANHAEGSRISLTASPTIISDGLSQTLTVLCSLRDTNSTSTPTPDIQHVTSIIITRGDDDPVAAVTTFDPATPKTDFGNLVAEGDLYLNGAQPPERGYLKLTWIAPGYNQSDLYKCEINAIDDQGHNVKFTSVTEIGIESPSEAELITHLHEVESNNTFQQHEINDLKETVNQLLDAVAGLTPHTEEGYVDCGDSTHWHFDSANDDGKAHTQKVVFQQPYKSPPRVAMGIAKLDVGNEDYTRYNVSILNVDTTGFLVKCQTWAGTHLFSIVVRWTSSKA